VQDQQRWIDENRPSGDPDYERIVDATNAIEAEIVKVGPEQALNRRFDYDMVMNHGKRRTEETSQKVRLENSTPDELLMRLGAAWAEGFTFGALAYAQEGRGRKSEAFLDRIALANINHKLAQADEQSRTEIFAKVIHLDTLGFVSTVRSFQARNILAQEVPVANHAAVKALVGSHWLDGFFVGLVFEELGGHREAA
jgi:hypothetical protein